jgi:Tol biopolymer transport system component
LFSLSPDGRGVAFARQDETAPNFDVWWRDLVRGSDTRLTSTGNNLYPIWSADGTDVFFMSNRNGQYTVAKKAARRSESDSVVETAREYPMDASRDGQYLLTLAPNNRSGAVVGGDIRVLKLSGDGKSVPFLATAFLANRPKLSPDGHWLAYQSDESKRSEVYVVSFPDRGIKMPISIAGGRIPVWSPNGDQLYYLSLDDQIMSVAMTPGAPPQFGVPKALFEMRLPAGPGASFDVSKEGHFLVPVSVDQAAPAMTVVLNWPELLKDK